VLLTIAVAVMDHEAAGLLSRDGDSLLIRVAPGLADVAAIDAARQTGPGGEARRIGGVP
jgi:hypothetical protein